MASVFISGLGIIEEHWRILLEPTSYEVLDFFISNEKVRLFRIVIILIQDI